MKKETPYDVIIIGSGPAGAMLGYLLAERAIKTLILEKERLPRYKPCGGGLTRRAFGIMPFNINTVVEDFPRETRIFVQNRLVFSHSASHPVLAMVMRDRFDHFLALKAVDRGAVLYQGIRFSALSGKAGDLRVETATGTYRARVIAGADGVNSRVARALGLAQKINVMQAVAGEVYADPPERAGRFKGSADFDFLGAPHGYGWVFPKKDHLSVGVLSVSKKVKNLQEYLKTYLKAKGMDGVERIAPPAMRLIPYGPGKRRLYANARGLLVGDAAGVVDPVTGEGIYYAVRSAQLACRAIMHALDTGLEDLIIYNRFMWDEFDDELACAGHMAYLLYRFPLLSSRLLRFRGEGFGKRHLAVINGKKTYRDLYRQLFSALKAMVSNGRLS